MLKLFCNSQDKFQYWSQNLDFKTIKIPTEWSDESKWLPQEGDVRSDLEWHDHMSSRCTQGHGHYVILLSCSLLRTIANSTVQSSLNYKNRVEYRHHKV